jgi:aspartate/methionine/tyrosine aminotransferase
MFGAHGRQTHTSPIDLTIGSVRGIPELDAAVQGLSVETILAKIGEYPGTQGPMDCLETLAELWALERLGEVDPACFVLTHGALDGLGHAIASLPDDAIVVFPEPGFGFGLAVERMGRRPSPVLWRIDEPVSAYVDRAERVLRNSSAPAAIIASFPANPSGACASAGDLLRLRDLATMHGGFLLLDDVYRFTQTSQLIPDLDDVVVVDSASKRVGLPGLRFGYVCTTGARLSAIRASVARSSVGVGTPTASIARHVLDRYCNVPSIRSGILDELSRRRELVRSTVPQHLKAELILADQSIYGCMRLPEGADVDAFCRQLCNRGVMLTPSTALFSYTAAVEHRPFVRFCIGADDRLRLPIKLLCEELDATANGRPGT